MHEYTDLPFRLLCQRYGAAATCVPLVHSTAVVRNEKKLASLDSHPHEHHPGVQLVGCDPADLARCCSLIESSYPSVSWFNLNCGCPSSQTLDSGGGAALLKQPDRIITIVDALLSQTDLPVSVKLRLKEGRNGLTETMDLCKRLCLSGVSFIIVHGRTAGQGYSGRCDWTAIKAVMECCLIPVVGNGDIQSASEGRLLVEQGFCDSFMVGRAAMGNPLLFEDRAPQTLAERFVLLEEYLELYRKYGDVCSTTCEGEPRLNDVKMKALNFVRGTPDASALRNRISRASSIDEILSLKD